MPFRPAPVHRRNVHGVIRPLTQALLRVYGSRAQDGARPIGAFYNQHVDGTLWLPLGGIWYRPLNEELICQRAPNETVVAAFSASILSGDPVLLPSGTVVEWEALSGSEAAQLPPPMTTG